MTDLLKQYASNWKVIAGAGLAAFMALNGVFHWEPASTMEVILSMAAALGIALHGHSDVLAANDPTAPK